LQSKDYVLDVSFDLLLLEDKKSSCEFNLGNVKSCKVGMERRLQPALWITGFRACVKMPDYSN